MENLILIAHTLTALAIIVLILLQRGKGAEAGASFGGGASQTVFGSQGGGNFFTRVTAVLATVFFVTSFSLAVVAKRNASSVGIEGIPVQEDAIPALVEDAGDIPAVEEAESTAEDIPQIPGE